MFNLPGIHELLPCWHALRCIFLFDSQQRVVRHDRKIPYEGKKVSYLAPPFHPRS